MTAQPEAVALASRALDVLERAAVHDTLEEALAPVTLAFALTTRVRDLGPPPATSAKRPAWPGATWTTPRRAWWRSSWAPSAPG